MMKRFWIFATIMTICGSMMLSSCSKENLEAPTNNVFTEGDMKQAAIGLRLDLSNIVLGSDKVRIWDFKENNSFVAYDLYTDNDGNFAVEKLSGTWEPFINQTLDWDIDEKIQACGINAIYDDAEGQPGNPEYKETFYGFNTPDENNEMKDEDLYFLSESALGYLAYTESIAEHPELYENNEDSQQASTRAASVEDFNPTKNKTVKLLGEVSNKVTLTKQGLSNKGGQQQTHQTVKNIVENETRGVVNNPNDANFNNKTWRTQNSILLWDGEKNITVQLPWSTQVTNNNLPMNFCNDITPANGWDLVMNYCGEKVQTIGSSGYHFFAVYNKYTGILRFFTYVPENFNANNANDHAWEVTVGEQTAQHLGFRYGLPMDKRIADRAAIGMNSTDYNVYCSPWVASRSKDGYITPNQGWWAFDVDLSNYRPGYASPLERIRLQMRAWANSNVSFNSVLSAKVKQEVPGTAYNCNSLSGIVSMVTDIKDGVSGLVSGISSGKWIESIKSGFDLMGKGYNIFTSIRDIETAKPQYNVVNTIDGTIDTKGLISGTVNVARVTSPDMPITRFDTKNTTLGQGVWNIKSSPVVYQLDAKFEFKEEIVEGQIYWPTVKALNATSRFFSASPCVFDPSSVEVELNPNVFPKDDIEYVDVKTFCAVRKNTKHDTSNEYRKAFGLPIYNEFTLSNDHVTISDHKMDPNNPAWDFLHGSSDKLGLTYPKVYSGMEKEDQVHYSLLGRGNDDALLEPILFGYDTGTWKSQTVKPYLPFYEVTVQVNVKLKSLKTPLIYTRVYLPEVRRLDFNKAKGVVKHAEEWLTKVKNTAKNTDGTNYQEYQVRHLKEVLSFIKPGYENAIEGVTFTSVSNGGDYITKLFDNNLNTSWAPSISARVNGSYWETEFKASKPLNVKSYTLYNDANWNEYKSEPTLWAISAKDKNGNWIQIDDRRDEQPQGNSASKKYQVKVPGTYQEFKLKVVNYNGSLSGFKRFWGSDLRLRIAELIFHED